MIRRPVRCALLYFLLVAAADTAVAQQANWFTAMGTPGNMKPLSVHIESIAKRDAERGTTFLIDLSVSVYKDPLDPSYPAGDNDGNAQGAVLSEQDRYEIVFQHFADAIYEATEGAHKIRGVRIFNQGRRPPGTNIVWNVAGQPNVLEAGGVLVPGSHINMFDVYPNGTANSDLALLDSEDNRQRAGYLLAHLWMRYFYGVGAEYAIQSDDIPVTSSLMNNPLAAVTQSDAALLNLSVTGDGLPPFDAFEHTRATQQHRLYLSSIWDTLARHPALDPKSGEHWARAPRLHFPEFSLVAPPPFTPPLTNLAALPGSVSNSRSDLDITWIEDFLMWVLVLDVSGSMSGEKLDNMKAAAKMLVHLAEDEVTKVGIVTFSSAAQVLYPATNVTPATRAAMLATIDALVAGGGTAMGDGARLGLQELLANGADECIPVAFVLSDGQTNSGEDPSTVIPDYQSAQIPMFTFAYGLDADVVLMEHMATSTGGEFFLSDTTLSAIASAFSSAATRISGLAAISATRDILIQLPKEFIVVADSTLKRLDLTAIFDRPASALVYSLQPPTPGPVPPPSVATAANGTVVTYTIDNPQSGAWILSAATTSGIGSIEFTSNGVPNGSTPRLSVTSALGNSLQYPDPIIIQADLNDGLPIRGALVEARIVRPGGFTEQIFLRDDGVSPDRTADDGRYSAIDMYATDGVHRIEVTATGNAFDSFRTYRGTLPAPSISATGAASPNMPADVPVTETFVRRDSVEVTVSGSVDDDHGDFPVLATTIDTDNVDVRCVINFPGDYDMFKFFVTPQLASDTFVIRITERGRGYTPRLIVFEDPTSLSIFEDVTLEDAGVPFGYLALPLTREAGTTVYFAVRDDDPGVGGGVYTVSVGPLIPGDLERVDSSGGGGGGGGGCFIATAAYGTPMASQLDPLRAFRDRHLLDSTVGTTLADAYYRVSPVIAQRLAQSDASRAAARFVIAPIVWMIEQPRTALVIAVEAGLLLLVLMLARVSHRARRRSVSI